MASTTSTFVAPREIATTVPALPGLPVIGNLLAFRRDRLGLQDRAAQLASIARLSIAHIPMYVVTDADAAHQILVDDAAAFKKSQGLKFLMPLLGEGLLTAEGVSPMRFAVAVKDRVSNVRRSARAGLEEIERLRGQAMGEGSGRAGH